MAAVLKTAVQQCTVGSNPTLSAIFKQPQICFEVVFFCLNCMSNRMAIHHAEDFPFLRVQPQCYVVPERLAGKNSEENASTWNLVYACQYVTSLRENFRTISAKRDISSGDGGSTSGMVSVLPHIRYLSLAMA